MKKKIHGHLIGTVLLLIAVSCSANSGLSDDTVVLLSPACWESAEFAIAALVEFIDFLAEVRERSLYELWLERGASSNGESDGRWVFVVGERWTIAVPIDLVTNAPESGEDWAPTEDSFRDSDGFVVVPNLLSLPRRNADTENYYWSSATEVLAPMSGFYSLSVITSPTGVSADAIAGTIWDNERRLHVGLFNPGLDSHLDGTRVEATQKIGAVSTDHGALYMEVSSFGGEALDLVFAFRTAAH